MNSILSFYGMLAAIALYHPDVNASESINIPLFDSVVFYDGYAPLVNFPIQDGITRHRNDLHARKLSEHELNAIGHDLTLNVTIKASCDNYDRIGNFNLAFVPKGSSSYIPETVQRMEVGRFITPFMNENIQPNQVSYSFAINNVASIIKDPKVTDEYDIWVELEVFGVPYAAQTEVAGCKDRQDVFLGFAEFVSSSGDGLMGPTFFLPLNFKKDLNNYAAGASDIPGKTVRTIPFQLPKDLGKASFYLITSNHGANAGGEEYNRRMHFVYFDETLIGSYKPGGVSCEPYRFYNTQANGIYGRAPRTPEQWASFSNWCPGQAIPIREFVLGPVSAGHHTFRIEVPDAVFQDAQGYIPVSLHLQGTLQD